MNDSPLKIVDSKLGLLSVFNQDNIHLIEKKSFVLGGIELIPGQKTSLHNFFNDDVIYLGFYEDFLQFQIGIDYNLFETLFWCNEFKRINENHILTIYQLGTARNYQFKNGFWK